MQKLIARAVMVLSIMCLGTPLLAETIEAPSTEFIAEIDKLYNKEHDKAGSRITKYGHFKYNYKSLTGIPDMDQEDYRRLGLWHLKRAKTPLDYEKAFHIWNVGGKRSNDIRYYTYLPKNLSLYMGQAAAIAAEYYADKESKHQNLRKAVSLHQNAGNLGIQQSWIEAGFLLKSIDHSKEIKKTSYTAADFIAFESNLFGHAADCESNKKKKYFSQDVLPWTHELCDKAKTLRDDAWKRYLAVKPTYVPRGRFRR